MSESTTPDLIKALEQDVRGAIQKQDFTEALDICEEIDSKGGSRAPHLAAKGQCLLKLRRKQDAKSVLLRAFELDPGYQIAVNLLDENFPGWTRPKPAANPPPVFRPASAYTQLGATQTAPQYYAAPPGGAPQAPSYAPPPPHQVQTGAPVQNAPQQGAYSDYTVNWRYVMEDLDVARVELQAAGNQAKAEPAGLSLT
jgi:hypothetical protein